jgi:hypothetical protein
MGCLAFVTRYFDTSFADIMVSRIPLEYNQKNNRPAKGDYNFSLLMSAPESCN